MRGSTTLENWTALAGKVNTQRLGISRTTVIKAVNSQARPRYERSPGATSFTVFEPRVRVLPEQTPYTCRPRC